MRDRDLYAKILGITAPWTVVDVKLDSVGGDVEVSIKHEEGKRAACPVCGDASPRYDKRKRRWRHLDTCQYRTILVADVPRVNCRRHGVHQIKVPWAEPGSSFTALFEALAIDWLKEASIKGVAAQLRLTWDQVDGIMSRAVDRGLFRQRKELPCRIGVDEKSVGRGQDYLTVVTDLEQPHVLYVGEGRTRECLHGFYTRFSEEELAQVEVVAMDMCRPYIEETKACVPDAEQKIAFDKFHVAQHLGKGVDKVRRLEHKDLLQFGPSPLTKTKYLWLTNPENMKEHQAKALAQLRRMDLKTARAWAIKEHAMTLWDYARHGWAENAWRRWLNWTSRCRLEPMVKVGRMVRKHLAGILNAIVLNATNAASEGINSRLQWIKYMARGFRNRVRFRYAIYFHLGGLDLYPASLNP